MEILIEHLDDETDELRDLRNALSQGSTAEHIEEVLPPLEEGALGGELTGLLVQIAPEAFPALTSVLVAWLHRRRGRIRLTLKVGTDGTKVLDLKSTHGTPKDSVAAIEAFLTGSDKLTNTNTQPIGEATIQPGGTDD
ncbi:effector-associated constant component EACC1 [Streptomyces sp. NPDC054783]